MRKAVFILGIILFGVRLTARAQKSDSTRAKVQQDLENALESFDPSDPNLNTEQLTQVLEDLASNPVNINEASSDNLLLIPGVNLRKARAIIAYRRDEKPFESVSDLLEVSGIGKATLERMRPYVSVGSGLQLSKTLYGNRHYWTNDGHFEAFSRYQQTLQQQEGYIKPDSEGGYLGSPAKYYQRFRYQSDHLSLNLTQQKDAGEPFAGANGFDYTSGHLALENNGKLRELVIGDYALYFGQGLVLWNGRTFGKGREVISAVDRISRGVRSYASSQESDFYRGIAATYGRKLQITGFYSSRNQTASHVSEDTLRMLKDDGYHRTVKEQNQRGDLQQKVYGGRVQIELPFGIVGASGYQTSFNQYVTGGTLLSDKYDFNGTQNAVFGLDYTILAGPAILFGEGGRSQNGGLGFLSGVESSVGANTDLTIAYRNYAKNFQSFLGNGFGEHSGAPKNEEGIYFGLRHTINKSITLSGYFDQYNSPAPRFGTHQPTQGHDWLALAMFDITPKLQFYMQARSETEDEEYASADSLGRAEMRLGDARRSSLRAQFQYQVNPKVRLRTRGEIIQSLQAGKSEEYGYLLYQDLQCSPGPAWTIDGRITLFDTDSYDTRLYQFENDLLYVLSNKVLYDQGQRMYLLVDFEPLSYLEIWAKFGITIFENKQIVGSGLDEIQGDKRSDVGLEVRLKF